MANFHVVNALSMNIKDSRWLQLEVCREYQRNKCSRSDTECKFAHPQPHVEVQNGKVTACFDSIKGRCNREKPPCKYFHPPQHLKEQLLINGRNNLAIKNALMQQFAAGSLPMPGTVPVNGPGQMVLAYASGAEMTSPTAQMYNLPPNMTQFYTAAPTQAVGEAGMVAPLAMPQLQQKMQRSDRLEGEPAYDAQVYFGAFPGMGVAYKRSAGDKAGMPCYPAHNAASYQQLMLQQQQNYLHQTSCEYPADQERPGSAHSGGSAGAPATSGATASATNGLAGAASPPPSSSASDSGAGGHEVAVAAAAAAAAAAASSQQTVTVSSGLASTLTTSSLMANTASVPLINPAMYTGYSISKAALPAAGRRRPARGRRHRYGAACRPAAVAPAAAAAVPVPVPAAAAAATAAAAPAAAAAAAADAAAVRDQSVPAAGGVRAAGGGRRRCRLLHHLPVPDRRRVRLPLLRHGRLRPAGRAGQPAVHAVRSRARPVGPGRRQRRGRRRRRLRPDSKRGAGAQAHAQNVTVGVRCRAPDTLFQHRTGRLGRAAAVAGREPGRRARDV